MFVTPTVSIPCHGDANNLPFGSDPYLAAATAFYGYQSQTQNQEYVVDSDESNNWSGMFPPKLPFSTNRQQTHGYDLHPHWRAIMGEEAWYQSISDFEEENYFNSPHLQHPRHGNAVAIKGEEAMEDIIPFHVAEVKADPSTHVSHYPMIPPNGDVLNSEPILWSDGATAVSHHLSAWPGDPDLGYLMIPAEASTKMSQQPYVEDSFPVVGAFEEKIFGSTGINRDLDALIGPPLEIDGLPGLPYGYSLQSQESVQPAMMHHCRDISDRGQYSPASPVTPLTSQEEDIYSVAYSPSMNHNAFTYVMDESSYGHHVLHSSSPRRGEKQHQSLMDQSLMKSVRRSLPNSPMRVRKYPSQLAPYPAVRSTSFGESSSSFSSVRSMSPRDLEHHASSIQLAMKESTSSSITPSSSSSPIYSVDERAAKDEFLVTARRAGMTYRDIKLQGGFAEAESTLRGRYRMLTKSREERVRNPKWTPVDVVLLRKAVQRHCNGRDPVLVKIPWKEIARFIVENGGTYLFGNATCRKKWDELATFGIEQEVEDEDDILPGGRVGVCEDDEGEDDDMDEDGEYEDEEMKGL